MNRDKDREYVRFKIGDHMLLGFFVLALIFMLLPYIKIVDAGSGKTTWLNVIQSDINHWKNDEDMPTFDNSRFALHMVIGIILISIIFKSRLPGFCLAVQAIVGLLAGLLLINHLHADLPLFDESYPIAVRTFFPALASILLIVGSLLSFGYLVNPDRDKKSVEVKSDQ